LLERYDVLLAGIVKYLAMRELDASYKLVAVQRAVLKALRFYNLTFMHTASGSEDSRLDGLFLVVSADRPALAIGPGFDLNALAVSLTNAGVLPNMRDPQSARVWATMALLCNVPERWAIPDSGPLPLSLGTDLPNAALQYRETYWRPWLIFNSSDGIRVELPWIEEERLVRGSIVVPINGIDMKILPKPKIIASGINWAIPHWVPPSGGTRLSFRRWPRFPFAGIDMNPPMEVNE
jgi:hypothetical protein